VIRNLEAFDEVVASACRNHQSWTVAHHSLWLLSYLNHDMSLVA